MSDEIQTQETQASTETNAAVNPALHAAIKANFNNQVDLVDTKFNFKKTDLKDSDGKVIGETKRPSLELKLPVPSVEGIIEILQKENNAKELELLLEAVRDVVTARARDIINDDEAISADTFPYKELSWEAIANLPKAERRGGGISKEIWEDFTKDYIAVMPGVTGKTAERVELAAKVFINKFSTVKTDKPVLKVLRDQLALYANSSPNAEKFAECIEFLTNKANGLIDADSSKLLDNL
jgi:hypothetical protein